jgi:hypothetical protein
VAQEISPTLISDFIRPVVEAIPKGMVQRLGHCQISILEDLGRPSIASQWTPIHQGIEVELAVKGREGHDIALELLLCIGQALWERINYGERKAYWLLLDDEIRVGITGEIDDEALKQKRLLLSNRHSASSRRRLERYGCASFAGTAAEYVHSLWHDVTIRTGPAFVPAQQLRRRLQLLTRWYPPDRGHPLFPGCSQGQ